MVLAVMRRTRAAALDHEWFSDLLGGRPHLGRTRSPWASRPPWLSQATGLHGIHDLQRVLGALNAFVPGALRQEIAERRTARATGTDVATWQAAHGPYLTRMLDTGRYPTVRRLVLDGAHLDAEDFRAQPGHRPGRTDRRPARRIAAQHGLTGSPADASPCNTD